MRILIIGVRCSSFRIAYMNYGFRYSFALGVGLFLAIIWVWLFSPSPPFFNFSFSAADFTADVTNSANYVASFINNSYLFFYSPHLFIFSLFTARKLEAVDTKHNTWDFFQRNILSKFSYFDDKEAISTIILVVLIAFPIVISLFVTFIFTLIIIGFTFFNRTEHLSRIIWLYIISLVIPLLLLWLPRAYIILKEELSTHPRFRRWFSFGKGGSARWAGIRNYRKHKDFRFYMPAKEIRDTGIYLGKTMFEDTFKSFHIGLEDDAHILTIGCTGSGKSTTVLWTNIATYAGSMFIVDPKGEHARMTFWRRSNQSEWQKTDQPKKTKYDISGKSYLLDPFHQVPEIPSSRYNPLSDIDIESDRVRGMLSAISDACVFSEGSKINTLLKWLRFC